MYDLEELNHVATFPQEGMPDRNVSLPVAFIHNDTSLLLGSSCGHVSIVNRKTRRQLLLDHGGFLRAI